MYRLLGPRKKEYATNGKEKKKNMPSFQAELENLMIWSKWSQVLSFSNHTQAKFKMQLL